MSPTELALRLLLAAGLGAVVGIEREFRHKAAGLRTNILISVGSALFTVVSIQFADHGGTSDRTVAQVVTGVGFLGAGAIMRSGSGVHGLTTAATIWVVAAIGMAAGAGEFAIASVATLITLVVLAVLLPLEIYFDRRAGRTNQPTG
jgi:putative Mg2+ transporter-C (MgtC) family protein